MSNPETIIRNFILLAYADVFNKRSYDLVGTSNNRNELVVYSYISSTGDFDKTFDYLHSDRIYAVMPGNFDGSGTTDFLLVVKKDNNHFQNTVLRKNTKEPIKLPDSESPPFLYTNGETLQTSILLQTTKDLFSITINENYEAEKNKVSWLKKNERIANDHTSTFIDLDGDHKSDLAFVITKDDKKYLKIMSNSESGFKNFFEMELPMDISPLVFYDLKHKGTNDLIFISNEEGEYYLNIYYNVNDNSKNFDNPIENFNPKIFVNDKNYRKKINFNDICPDSIPILKNEKLDNVPCGFFSRDIDLDGNLDLIISVMKEGKKETVISLNYNPKSEVFDLNNNLDDITSMNNIISVSACDYSNKGKEDFIVNILKNGNLVVQKVTNELGIENMKLSVTTCCDILRKYPYGLGVFGVTYIILYDYKKRMAIISNIPPGPYLSFSNQTALVGLGSSSFMINSLRIIVPGYGKFVEPYHINYNIIQNLDLIIYIKHDSFFKVEAFFVTTRHFYTIIYVLLTVIITNVIVIIFLHARQKRKENAAKRTDRMNPLFRTL